MINGSDADYYPAELSVWLRINSVRFIASARASSPKGLSSDDSPGSIIIEMTIYRGGRILTPTYSMPSLETFRCAARRIMPAALSIHERTKKKRRIGATVERRVEKSRGFRAGPPLSVLVCIQDLRVSHGKSSWALCSPRKQVFEDQRGALREENVPLPIWPWQIAFGGWLTLRERHDRSPCVILEKVGQSINANQTNRL